MRRVSYQEQFIQDTVTTDTATELQTYNEKTRHKIDYVTAAQAQVYFNGLLVDECYDIQYSYREFKEPVYGYNDKYFAAVLPGTVIVQGSFTINYKHDAYLITALRQAQDDRGLSASIKKKEALQKQTRDYKSSLSTYRTALSEKKAKKQELKDAKDALAAANNAMEQALLVDRTQLDTSQLAIDQAKNSLNNYYDSLDGDQKAEVDEAQEYLKTIKTDHEANVENLQTGIAEAASGVENSRGKVTEIQAQIDLKEKEIDDIELEIDKIEGEQGQYAFYAISEREQFVEDFKADIKAIREEIGRWDIIEVADPNTESGFKEEWVATGLKADLADAKKQYGKDKDYLENIEDIFQEEVSDYEGKIESTLAGGWFDGDFVREYMRLKMNLHAREIEALALKESNKTQNDLLKDAQEQAKILVDTLESELSDLDIKIGQYVTIIQTSKTELQAIDREVKDKLEQKEQALKRGQGENIRAEDQRPFDIYLGYNTDNTNPQVHKVLKDCHIVGHSHVVTQSGEPVKEYYQFIARRIL